MDQGINTKFAARRAFKISIVMEEIAAAEPSVRAEKFAGVARSLKELLDEYEASHRGLEQSDAPDSPASFVRKARLYLRALETYSAATTEWLEVFWTLRKMFLRWIASLGLPAPTKAKGPVEEIERLRANPRLVFKEADADIE